MADIPVVQAVIAYTDPESGETFILVINQALFLGHDFQMSLINSNQLRRVELTSDKEWDPTQETLQIVKGVQNKMKSR